MSNKFWKDDSLSLDEKLRVMTAIDSGELFEDLDTEDTEDIDLFSEPRGGKTFEVFPMLKDKYLKAYDILGEDNEDEG